MPKRKLSQAEREEIEQDERDLAGTNRSSTERRTEKGHIGPAHSPLPSGRSNQIYDGINGEERQYGGPRGGRNGSKKKKRRNKKKSLKKSEIRSKKPKKKKGTRRRKV